MFDIVSYYLLDVMATHSRAWPGFQIRVATTMHVSLNYHSHRIGYLQPINVLYLQFKHHVAYELRTHQLAEPHPLLPHSAWITHEMPDDDFAHGLWLLEIAYLYHKVRCDGIGWGDPLVAERLAALDLPPLVWRALTGSTNFWLGPPNKYR